MNVSCAAAPPTPKPIVPSPYIVTRATLSPVIPEPQVGIVPEATKLSAPPAKFNCETRIPALAERLVWSMLPFAQAVIAEKLLFIGVGRMSVPPMNVLGMTSVDIGSPYETE
jgi:hypothetical protein